MTVEELIDFFNNDNYCSDYKCLDDNCKECQKKYIDKFLVEHDKQIRAEVIKEIALKIQKIKDNHNENPRLYPINYGTLCGICADLWEQFYGNS